MTHTDALRDAVWDVCSCAPGYVTGPEQLTTLVLDWMPATVPGTAGAALTAVYGEAALWHDYDGVDWWFRTRFEAPAEVADWVLEIGGLATIADVWLNGEHLQHSENMFLAHRVEVAALLASNELVIKCAALAPQFAARRPRPRWRSPRLIHQNLRWFRTALMGRLVGWVVTPPPVGPWRPITLSPRPMVEVLAKKLTVTCEGVGGAVDVELEVAGVAPGDVVTVSVGEVSADLSPAAEHDGRLLARGRVALSSVERWWPHTHGAQPLYAVSARLGGTSVPLGRVGFRTLDVDRSDRGFTIRCNYVPIYCRGACWTPPDAVGLTTPRYRRNLELYREAGLNMVRIVGELFYECQEFLDLCDELGILLWQDAMFAFYDAPQDADYDAAVIEELTQTFEGMQGRPCVAVVSGGSDTEEQAQFMGVPPATWKSPMATTVIPGVLESILPGTPYVTATPGESPIPTMINVGVSHYYGVGAYTRPLEDARRAGVRFAAECLGFGTPPEPWEGSGPAAPRAGMGQFSSWKNAIHNDAHSMWDQEDVQDWYTSRLFDVKLFEMRHRDPDRANLLSRATSAYVFEATMSEWRRADSSCAGSLVFHWHDLRFGAGLGIVDAHDRPKTAWYAMRRVMQPVALLLTDEGLNGLGLHLVNDHAVTFEGTVRIDLIVNGELRVESTEVAAVIPARGGTSIETAIVFDGFRDLSYAHKFGKPAHDAVVATLLDTEGVQVSQAAFVPGHMALPVEPDLGLAATVGAVPGTDEWLVTVSTRRFAQWVALEVPGYIPLDGWFHLPPGESRTIRVIPMTPGQGPPRGSVSAMNLARATRFAAAKD